MCSLRESALNVYRVKQKVVCGILWVETPCGPHCVGTAIFPVIVIVNHLSQAHDLLFLHKIHDPQMSILKLSFHLMEILSVFK